MTTKFTSDEIDLHYSPDEGIWYFQNYDTGRVSIDYPTRRDAITAQERDEIEWE
jgi:hypothetical protein